MLKRWTTRRENLRSEQPFVIPELFEAPLQASTLHVEPVPITTGSTSSYSASTSWIPLNNSPSPLPPSATIPFTPPSAFPVYTGMPLDPYWSLNATPSSFQHDSHSENWWAPLFFDEAASVQNATDTVAVRTGTVQTPMCPFSGEGVISSYQHHLVVRSYFIR